MANQQNLPGEDYESSQMPRLPDVTVHLSTGQDGNIMMIIGAVRVAMRRAGHSPALLDEFSNAVMSAGSYDESLRTVMRWVTVT